MSTIYDRLRDYSDSDYYGFHMPGHKRNMEMSWDVSPYKVDITEIEGFDDLHHAQGILKDAQKRAADLYGADETHFLVNGSTVGILSSILGVTKKGDSILVARNCHKSVYHAIYLNELNPVYLYPKFDSRSQLNTEISVEDVRGALRKYPQIRAVVIVSPTYDGVVSDVAAIAEVVHTYGLPLIVDEAHGAHFGFHSYFPENSNRLGADLVIHSVHKTLPAFTQTALLHVNGSLVNRTKIKRYLDMLQTSSPSYILMAGIDQCMEWLEQRREEIFEPYVAMLKIYREKLKSLRNIHLVEPEDVGVERYDRSKLILSVAGTPVTGKWLQEILLKDYHLQMEMSAGTYALAMTTVGDTEAGMKRLADALYEIDSKITSMSSMSRENVSNPLGLPTSECRTAVIPQAEVVMSIAEIISRCDEYERIECHVTANTFAEHHITENASPECHAIKNRILEDETITFQKKEKHIQSLRWRDAVGCISTEFAYLYPPGIPIIAPGERVTGQVMELLEWYAEHGFSIEGLEKEDHITVLL